MTKMHFTRAAEMVKAITEGAWASELPSWAPIHTGEQIETISDNSGNLESAYIRAVWTAEAFIILFREYNPRFNEAKFLKACGFD